MVGGDLAAVLGGVAALVYPPTALAWRWFSHIEHRFDALQEGITQLMTADQIDVADLRAFRTSVGERLERLEHIQGWR